jgi:hypothetical protein
MALIAIRAYKMAFWRYRFDIFEAPSHGPIKVVNIQAYKLSVLLAFFQTSEQSEPQCFNSGFNTTSIKNLLQAKRSTRQAAASLWQLQDEKAWINLSTRHDDTAG